MEIYQIIIGVTALLAILILWFLRKFASADATRNAIRSKYKRLREEGLPESECLFRLLSTRRGWKRLPQAFLQELSRRLRNWERIADFIALSERELLDRGQFRRIAQNDPDMQDPDVAMRAVALALTRYYPPSSSPRKNPCETETALRLGTLIAPDDGIAALKLAVHHYSLERYREALPLFERGLKLVDDDMTKFKRLEAALSSHEIALPPEVFGTDDEIEDSITISKALYEDCKQKVGDS